VPGPSEDALGGGLPVRRASIYRLSAWDGLPLCVRVWPGCDGRPPILGFPGLVRTGADFEALAAAIGEGRRLVAVDYPGRGDSGRSRDVRRYAPEACVRDILDICAALHLHRVVAVGTSFGGLLAMGLATARPGLIKGVLLNDIGPELGTEGSEFVRRFVALDPAFESVEACVAFLRDKLPPLSLRTSEEWRRMAELTYAPGRDRRFHPVWDTRIARLLTGPLPDLWPLFDALSHVPLLLIRGELSNILLPATVARMQRLRPDMPVVTLPGIGHAPILTEPPALAALTAFLEQDP
jgi:pimeloyl-ACP methyl ester carboxylesterase